MGLMTRIAVLRQLVDERRREALADLDVQLATLPTDTQQTVHRQSSGRNDCSDRLGLLYFRILRRPILRQWFELTPLRELIPTAALSHASIFRYMQKMNCGSVSI